jgi:hypothetical protein
MPTAVDRRTAQQFKLPEPAAKASLALAGGPPMPPARPPPIGFAGGAGETRVEEPLALTVGRLNWPQLLGGYAGSLVLGALVGWAAGGKQGIYAGAASTSFLWSTGETVKSWRQRHWAVSLGFLVLAAPSAVVVYRKLEQR